MKYPIFAFLIGGGVVEGVNLAATGKVEAAFVAMLFTFIAGVVGAVFEAVWNFKP